MSKQETKDSQDLVKSLPPIEKAAILLMSLGEENAAEVLRHMGPKEVQKIGLCMAKLQNVRKDQVEAVMADFMDLFSNQTALGVGADGYIRKMLVNALGEDKAGTLVDRILTGGNTTGLDTLRWMDSRSVADIIRFEHPQIQAIVVACLDSDQAAETLSFFDEKVRLDIIMRIASLESVQPHAMQELNDILEKQFSKQTGSASTNMGGSKCAADIMNFLDTSAESSLMEGIKDIDEELAQEISDLMFVFDNLGDVDDRGIQALLREVSSESLILALKGADENVKEKIFGNMSKRAAELLRDDLEAKGPVKLSEVETAQKEILGIARRMADAGEIVLGGKGGEEMI
jgi:flagellar motor switch protein FliG